jgi:ankyrin repeat protein
MPRSYYWTTGADVNGRHRPFFRTALMEATKNGCMPSVTSLLDQGADVGLKDINMRTAFIIAAEKGHAEALDLLLAEYGDEPAENSGPLKEELFLCAAWCGRTGTVEHLVRRGFDIESKDGCRRTALTFAAEQGSRKAVEELLQAGADIDAEDTRGDTALWTAARWGKEKVVELLLQAGTNIEARGRRGFTPLITACCFGRETVAKWLLEEGAKIGAKDARGRTALSHAAAMAWNRSSTYCSGTGPILVLRIVWVLHRCCWPDWEMMRDMSRSGRCVTPVVLGPKKGGIRS